MSFVSKIALVVLAVTLIASYASATIVDTGTGIAFGASYANGGVSNSDLVNYNQPTLSSMTVTSTSNPPGSGPSNIINDGGDEYAGWNATVWGYTPNGTFNNGQQSCVWCPYRPGNTVDSTVIFTLNTTTMNSLGYDITSASVFTDDVTSRYGQNYWSISYATVTAPSTWVKLWTTTDYTSPSGGEFRVTVANTGGGTLSQPGVGTATGVAAVMITFPANGAYDPSVTEIDVFGTATTPEPGTLALLAAGLAGLLCYAWRKRR